VSHIQTGEAKFNDLASLKKAVERMGGRFTETSKQYIYYGGTKACDHEIVFPGVRYTVGVVKRGDAYDVEFDLWSTGGLRNRIGEGAGLLKQAYGIERAKAIARLRGIPVKETVRQDGHVLLEVSR